MVIVEYIRNDRTPQCCYSVGDVAGYNKTVSDALIAQGFVRLYDAGNGPGRPVQKSVHLREPWENEHDPVWLARSKSVDGALSAQAERASARAR